MYCIEVGVVTSASVRMVQLVVVIIYVCVLHHVVPVGRHDDESR